MPQKWRDAHREFHVCRHDPGPAGHRLVLYVVPILLLAIADAAAALVGVAYGRYHFATAEGEKLDPDRHEQRADVKAVTLHRFQVEKTNGGWKATTILDI